jgi:pimeloyl-ACP methyl ester carboxylesterase
LVVGVAATAALTSAMSVVQLHAGRAVTRRLSAEVKACTPETSNPVVLTTDRFFPQLDWPDYFRYTWLAADIGGPEAAVAARLPAQSVDALVLVGSHPVAPAGYRVTRQCGPGVVALQRVSPER